MNTEHIDIGLARYSDATFTAAVAVLVLALVLLCVEFAASRGVRADRRQLVAAGSSGAATADPDRPGVVAAAPVTPTAVRMGRAGLALVYAGMALLFACIVRVSCVFLGEDQLLEKLAKPMILIFAVAFEYSCRGTRCW